MGKNTKSTIKIVIKSTKKCFRRIKKKTCKNWNILKTETIVKQGGTTCQNFLSKFTPKLNLNSESPLMCICTVGENGIEKRAKWKRNDLKNYKL